MGAAFERYQLENQQLRQQLENQQLRQQLENQQLTPTAGEPAAAPTAAGRDEFGMFPLFADLRKKIPIFSAPDPQIFTDVCSISLFFNL